MRKTWTVLQAHPRLSRAAGLCALAVAWGCGGCSRTLPAPGEPGDFVTLEVKGRQVTAEVACDGPSRQLGLMNRESLPENEGMLFIFARPDKLSFWMKNTLVPLSIAFIDNTGKILQIEDMKPKDESSTLSKNPVRYALEVNRGWFARNGIGVGDSIAEFPDKVRKFGGR